MTCKQSQRQCAEHTMQQPSPAATLCVLARTLQDPGSSSSSSSSKGSGMCRLSGTSMLGHARALHELQDAQRGSERSSSCAHKTEIFMPEQRHIRKRKTSRHCVCNRSALCSSDDASSKRAHGARTSPRSLW